MCEYVWDNDRWKLYISTLVENKYLCLCTLQSVDIYFVLFLQEYSRVNIEIVKGMCDFISDLLAWGNLRKIKFKRVL